MWIVLEFRLGDEDGWRVCKWQNGGKYNKVEEVDRKLKDLEGRLNNELDWNVDESKVAFASDKEELDREQWKKNSVIYKLSEIDSEEAEDRRCGDSLHVHELCESTLKVPIPDGDIANIYHLDAQETGKTRLEFGWFG